MVTVAQAFERFIQSLEPTSRQASEAKRQERHVYLGLVTCSSLW